jgi:hypothetical protein
MACSRRSSLRLYGFARSYARHPAYMAASITIRMISPQPLLTDHLDKLVR